MRETDSYIWMLRESLILWFSTKMRPCILITWSSHLNICAPGIALAQKFLGSIQNFSDPIKTLEFKFKGSNLNFRGPKFWARKISNAKEIYNKNVSFKLTEHKILTLDHVFLLINHVNDANCWPYHDCHIKLGLVYSLKFYAVSLKSPSTNPNSNHDIFLHTCSHIIKLHFLFEISLFSTTMISLNLKPGLKTFKFPWKHEIFWWVTGCM